MDRLVFTATVRQRDDGTALGDGLKRNIKRLEMLTAAVLHSSN